MVKVKQSYENKLQKLTELEPEEKDSTRSFAVSSLKARADAKRSYGEKFADWITNVSGSVFFLTLNIVWFTVWITINVGAVPGIEPFDPYPFGFLTMCVSLEAIILAVIVLLSQNRAARIDDIREEIDLHINKISEAEITQIIKMLSQVLQKQGVDVSKDKDLQRMLRPLSSAEIERKLEQQTEKHKHTNVPLPSLPQLPVTPWSRDDKK